MQQKSGITVRVRYDEETNESQDLTNRLIKERAQHRPVTT